MSASSHLLWQRDASLPPYGSASRGTGYRLVGLDRPSIETRRAYAEASLWLTSRGQPIERADPDRAICSLPSWSWISSPMNAQVSCATRGARA